MSILCSIEAFLLHWVYSYRYWLKLCHNRWLGRNKISCSSLYLFLSSKNIRSICHTIPISCQFNGNSCILQYQKQPAFIKFEDCQSAGTAVDQKPTLPLFHLFVNRRLLQPNEFFLPSVNTHTVMYRKRCRIINVTRGRGRSRWQRHIPTALCHTSDRWSVIYYVVRLNTIQHI